MSRWTVLDRQIGVCSAICVPILGLAYILCGAAGLYFGAGFSLDALLPAEPYASICRVIMLALIADLVVIFAAVHAYAPRNGKTCSLAALAFCILFAAIAGVNTFLLLVIARQAANEPSLALLFSFRWPSMNLALDLFAWGPVLGLAFLFAAPVFHGDRLQSSTRAALILAGILCEGNILCFVVGDPRFSILGILGYDLVLPVVCVCLAILFWRSETSVA